MAYLDYTGLAYFKSLLDENYLRTSYDGDTVINGNVTFTNDIVGNLDGKAKKDWRGQQIDSTYIKDISTNDNIGQIVYTKGDGTSNYIMIDMMQGATASAAGKAGLVPAPTISERTKFLRGDGEWSVPTDIYVTQNLINTNDSFPILIGAVAGATQSQVGTAIAFGTKVSVNPNTHALIADHLILKHPTYRRSNNVSSKVMYTLNFADSDDGNGNNLSEIYGYIDPAANGGEHELGFRLFGNPNVQGVEEIFTYLSVGLSSTNIPYGHAPETPVPADHNEDTDIITRSYLKLNGSITGLVHTTMPETINGIKTFTDETRNTSSAGIITTKFTASDKITGTGTAEISGGSGNTPSLKVTGNETVTGDLNIGGSETVTGNISTANGTVSAKTGSIGSGGLTVTGPSNLNGKVNASNGLDVTGNTETDTLTVNNNETVGGTLTVTGKITGNGGAEINGGNGLKVTGNETITGKLTAEDLEATDDLTVGDTATIGGQILKKTGTNTTQEYVSYVTNQQETRNTIITNIVKPNGGLAIVDSGADKGKIYVKTGDGLFVDDTGFINVNFEDPDPKFIQNIVSNMIAPNGGLYYVSSEYLQEGETYIDPTSGSPRTVTAAQAAQTADGFPNPNFGKLLVDFSQIDENTKASILDGLDVQVPLKTNKTIYVDNADNVGATDNFNLNFDTRIATKFATIQKAVEWASSKLALGTRKVYIKIQGGTEVNPRIYRESVSLPTVNASSGYIVLDTVSGKKDVVVRPNKRSDGFFPPCFEAGSGSCYWILKHLKLDLELGITATTGQVSACVASTTSGARIDLYGCDYYARPEVMDESTQTRRTEITGAAYWVRMIDADEGGQIHLCPDDEGSEMIFNLPATNTANIRLVPINVSRDGRIYYRRIKQSSGSTVTDAKFRTYYCSGSCTTFFYAWQSGGTNRLGSGEETIKFDVPSGSSITGKRYELAGGSYSVGPSDSTYLGDVEGTVESSTYCWVSGV